MIDQLGRQLGPLAGVLGRQERPHLGNSGDAPDEIQVRPPRERRIIGGAIWLDIGISPLGLEVHVDPCGKLAWIGTGEGAISQRERTHSRDQGHPATTTA
jgi:hypothetical protein